MKKILITGGAGFIGTNLIKKLIERKFIIYAVDSRNLDKKNNLYILKKKKNFHYIKSDLTKDVFYKKFKIKVDIILHLASGVGVSSYIEDPYNLIISIYNPTIKLLDLSKKLKSHFIFASTSEIYGKNKITPWREDGDRLLGATSIPRWSYSSVKSTCEHLVYGFKKNNPDFKFTIIRLFNVYGPYQRSNFLISSFMDKIINNKKINIYDNGRMTRCFTYIGDTINCIIKIFNNKAAYDEVFNIGSNKENNILDVKNIFEKIHNKKIEYKFIDTKKLYKNKYEDIPKRIPNVSKVKKKLAWKATTSLLEGIKKTYNFYIKI